MARWLCALLLLGAANGALAIEGEPALADPALQARFEHLTDELRCLVCQNQTIADSNAPLAQDLRREVRSMLMRGASDEDILAFMTERYGDFVRYRPPFVPRTWLLWLAPGLLLLGGVLIAVRVVTRRARLYQDDPSTEPPA